MTMIKSVLMLAMGILNAVDVALCLPTFEMGARPK